MHMTHTKELKDLIDSVSGDEHTKKRVLEEILFRFAGRQIFIKSMVKQTLDSVRRERIEAAKQMLASAYSYKQCVSTLVDRYGVVAGTARRDMTVALEERRPGYAKG